MSDTDSFLSVCRGLQCGDDAAAARVFHRFAQRLHGLARARLSERLRQKIDAEDVVQSVFKSFFLRHAEKPFALAGWDELWSLLTVMAVRKCANQAQRYAADARALTKESAGVDYNTFGREPTPEEAAQLAETLEEALRPLDERERMIVTLSLQGQTLEEISTAVERAQRTVRRVLDRFRHAIERQLVHQLG
jgi:RNA polymerase sigma-70 factor, ECF subfamily